MLSVYCLAYHCKCVDPWLTTSKRVCPLCKRRVLSDDESSNSEDDSDGNPVLIFYLTSFYMLFHHPVSLKWVTDFFDTVNFILKSFAAPSFCPEFFFFAKSVGVKTSGVKKNVEIVSGKHCIPAIPPLISCYLRKKYLHNRRIWKLKHV